MKTKYVQIVDRNAVAKVLLDLAKQLSETGSLEIENISLIVPETVELKISAKSKEDKKSFKLSLNWYSEGHSEKEPSVKTKKHPSGDFKSLKKDMEKPFFRIRKASASGIIADKQDVEMLFSQSQAQLSMAKSAWKKEAQEFHRLVEDLKNAMQSKDLSKFQTLVNQIAQAKESCHEQYK